ncbi:MAG: hypothetical protein KDA63_11910 [Planctomycetales bacterium]|nr:hypothetical protein [Planctomycetales bacterium]
MLSDLNRQRRLVAIMLPLLALAALTGCKPQGTSSQASSSQVIGEGANGPGGYGDQGASDFDPIAVNGTIFQDWPQPKVAIVITGEQHGYLEPCGCSGLENQKGGLRRRHTLLEQLREKGWPLVALDVGGQVRRFGLQEEIKYDSSIRALEAMGYAAVGLGPDDLRLPPERLLSTAANLDESSPLRLVSANVGLFGFDDSLPPAGYRVVEAGGVRIGVTSVLGAEYQQRVQSDEVELGDAAEHIEQVLPTLREEADMLILLSHATPEESRRLAEQFPDFDVVATAGGAEEPPREPETLNDGKTWLVEMGHKGMYAAVIGLFNDEEHWRRYQRVPLDSRFQNSEVIQALFREYQQRLKTEGFDGLGLTPVVHPRSQEGGDPTLGTFVGSASCKECHPTAYGIWSKAGHAHATETLTKIDPPRQFDPECISCHATGWNPQEYVPYETGFVGIEETPELVANGCENCHGPGKAHVDAETAKDDRVQMNKLRQMMQLTSATAEAMVCVRCHDHDNSPEFNFEQYWRKIEHHGKR